MCARYPTVASRTPRFANDARICPGLNTARGNGNGPSCVPNSDKNPPSTVSPDVHKMTKRQSTPPNPFSRCGTAEPSDNPPTKVPSATPRPRRNHVAIAFNPGGYTSARLAPVRKRTGSALAGPVHSTSAAFTSAAHKAPSKINRRGRTRSKIADAKHPATNPSCTEMVISDPAPADKCHSPRNCGSTAEAENHDPMLKTDEPASTASARQRPGGSTFAAASKVDDEVIGEIFDKERA